MLMLLSGCGKIQPEQHAMNLFDKGEFVESIRTADAIIEKSLDKDIVYDMQVLKGRSLINLAIYDRESGNEDVATTKLEQALLVLTSAIEFRDDDPIPLYHRATVHDLLGNEMAGYKDSLAGKEIDPEHRTAYTNEIVHRDLEAEADQRYEAHKRVVDAKFVRPEFRFTLLAFCFCFPSFSSLSCSGRNTENARICFIGCWAERW